MALTTFYATGTASVANGATTITFSGAILGTEAQPNIMPGDLFLNPAQATIPPQRIASVDYTAGTATLAVNWPGTTMSSAAYEVRYVGIVERSTAQTRRLLEELSVVEANGRGLFYTFDTTTTDSDPGAGNLRLNNATIGSATAAYLDNLDADGATVSTILDTWDDAGSSVGRGQIWLRSISTPATFHAFNVTGSVVDGTGYRKLSLTYIGGSGSFASADEMMVMFLPAGAAGVTGTDGGIVLTFDGTATSGDPTAGKFRLNNATHASATAILIDNTDAAAGTISGLIDTWDDSTNAGVKGTLRIIATSNPAIWRVYSVSAVTDSTGFRTVAVTYVAGNGSLGDGTECSLFFSRTGDKGADGTNGTNGVDGAGLFTRVRAVATSNITISTALNNGDSLDGVTLATNDLVLVTGQSTAADNGVYVVGASPARDSSFDTYDEHPGAYFSVMEGTANADTLWRCTSNKGGTIGSTALVFEQFTSGGSGGGEVSNLGLAFSVASSALTVALKQADGSTNPSSGAGAVKAKMRSSTAGSGAVVERSATSAVSLTISSGSTLGHTSGNINRLYWYLIDNSGTLELAVSGTDFGEQGIVSTTAEGAAGAADSLTLMYSATARSNVPFRQIARTLDTQTTAGTWAAVPTAVEIAPYAPPIGGWEVITGGGRGVDIVSAVSAWTATNLGMYRRLRLSYKLTCSVDNAFIRLRTSVDNGANYDAGASDYSTINAIFNGTTNTNGVSGGETAFTLTGAGNVPPAEFTANTIEFFDFNQAAHCAMRSDGFSVDGSGVKTIDQRRGIRVQATARNAVQITFSSGTFSGELLLEGMRG